MFFAYGGYIMAYFRDGRIHGTAVIRFPNTNTYIGDWRDGKQQGRCLKYIRSQGHWLLEEYENGQLRHVVKDGMGRPPMKTALFGSNYDAQWSFVMTNNPARTYIDERVAVEQVI